MLIKSFPQDDKIVKRIFRLLDSTLKRLKKESQKLLSADYQEDFIQCSENDLLNEWLAILETCVLSPKQPMAISTITKEFDQKTGKNFSNCFIRSTMKRKIDCSYRTISNRVPTSQTKKNKMMKVLFWTKQMTLFYLWIILVNIDESNFDRSLHKRCSWLPLKGSKISMTCKPKGKWKLVCLLTKRNPFITAFLLILKLLTKVLKDWDLFNDHQIVFTLDNAKTHTSKLTKHIRNELEFPTMLLPPY